VEVIAQFPDLLRADLDAAVELRTTSAESATLNAATASPRYSR
jgi:hypothetical protein